MISHIPSFLNCPLRFKTISFVFRIPHDSFYRFVFGGFDEFKQSRNFFFWLLIETAFPIIRCQAFSDILLHREIRMPAMNNARTRQFSGFFQAIRKGNLSPQFRTSDFHLIRHNLLSFVSDAIPVRARVLGVLRYSSALFEVLLPEVHIF